MHWVLAKNHLSVTLLCYLNGRTSNLTDSEVNIKESYLSSDFEFLNTKLKDNYTKIPEGKYIP